MESEAFLNKAFNTYDLVTNEICLIWCWVIVVEIRDRLRRVKLFKKVQKVVNQQLSGVFFLSDQLPHPPPTIIKIPF